MRPIRVATALSIVALLSFANAQQTDTNPSKAAQEQNAAAQPPGPILGGMGTANYIPIWAAPSFLVNSMIYQTNGFVGIGTTTPVSTLDVNGGIDALSEGYAIAEQNVLGIGSSATNGNLAVGVGSSNFFGAQPTDDTFVGYKTGQSNGTYGIQNTFVGSHAGSFSSGSGSQNTYIGAYAGAISAGDFARQNTFVGASAGGANGSGGLNVFLGASAGSQNLEGSANTFLGLFAGYYNTSGNNNIYIGNLGPQSGTESSSIRIGGDIGEQYGPQTAAYIAGIYYAMPAGGVPVYVNSNGQLTTQTSSLRFKEQVRDMGDTTDALMKLRPVTFVYKPEYANGEQTLQYGLIAEEVAKVYPELVAYDKDGQPYSVRYQYLSTMLLNEVQKQYRRAESEAEVIRTQEQKIDSQHREMEEMEQRLSRLEAVVGARVNTAQVVTGGASGQQ